MIQAIETRYKGYRFRSRLEARWAIALDVLGVSWEYEKEGFTLEDGTLYLPDFWIAIPAHLMDHDKVGRGYWMEIKGSAPTEHEKEKCRLLARGTGHVVFLVVGPPGPAKKIWKWYRDGRLIYDGEENDGDIPEPELLFWCAACTAMELMDQNYDSVGRAIEAARSARFEHGEQP